MAKLSSINKNNRRIKLSDKFYKKRQKLKKIVMDKKFLWRKDLKLNKNFLNFQEILLKIELWIDVKLQADHTVFTEN